MLGFLFVTPREVLFASGNPLSLRCFIRRILLLPVPVCHASVVSGRDPVRLVRRFFLPSPRISSPLKGSQRLLAALIPSQPQGVVRQPWQGKVSSVPTSAKISATIASLNKDSPPMSLSALPSPQCILRAGSEAEQITRF